VEKLIMENGEVLDVVGLVAIYTDLELFNNRIGNNLESARVRLFLMKDRGFYKNLVMMPRIIRNIDSQLVIRNYYVRGLWGPVVFKLAFPLRKTNYVYDVRGDLEDEFKAVQSKPFNRTIYLSMENWGIKNARSITAVTSVLVKKVFGKMDRQVLVIPCCLNMASYKVNDIRTKTRQGIGFEESDEVFVYSGGLSYSAVSRYA